MPAFRPDQSLAALTIDKLNASPEVTRITCLADAGTYETALVAYPAVASLDQADYVYVENMAGTKFAIWMDIDAAGTAPSGAVYTGATNKIEVNVVTGDSAIVVAGKVKTAVELNGNWADITITDLGNGTLRFTQDLVGNPTNLATYKEDDSTSGSIGSSVTAGVASSLQNKYFIMRNPAATVFNGWLNVGGEGVDPNPAGTEIACAITAGSSASSVAAQIATAINANANFKAWVQDSYLYVANEATGTAVDVTAGNSGFTVAKIQDGQAGYYYPAMNPSLLLVTPASIS